jgi:hypothetical protein
VFDNASRMMNRDLFRIAYEMRLEPVDRDHNLAINDVCRNHRYELMICRYLIMTALMSSTDPRC